MTVKLIYRNWYICQYNNKQYSFLSSFKALKTDTFKEKNVRNANHCRWLFQTWPCFFFLNPLAGPQSIIICSILQLNLLWNFVKSVKYQIEFFLLDIGMCYTVFIVYVPLCVLLAKKLKCRPSIAQWKAKSNVLWLALIVCFFFCVESKQMDKFRQLL